MRNYSMISIALALATGACAGSQAEQVRDAHMEQAEEQADAREKAVSQDEHARHEAIEQQADADKQRLDESNAPGAEPQKELVGVSEDRAKYQSEAKAKLDKLRVQLDEASQKIAVLGNKAPTALKGELETAKRQYQMLQQDVTRLDQTPPSNWESTTAKIDKGISSLDTRVSDLSDDIKDVS